MVASARPALAAGRRARGRWARRAPVWRRRLYDLGYLSFGLGFTLAVGGLTWRTKGWSEGVTALVMDLTVTVLLVALRRRRPVLVSLVAMAGVLAPGGNLFALAVFALAIRRRDRVFGAVCVAGWAAMTVVGAAGHPSVWQAGSSAAAKVGLAAATGAFLGARRDLMASLRDRADQAEAQLVLRAEQARLAERTRIAQEMHDILAHRISLVALHAGGLEVRPDVGPDEVERTAALIGATSRQALEDLRGVLGVLRADGPQHGEPLAPQPCLADLPRLVASSTAAGAAVRLEWAPDELAGAPEAVGRTVYHVVREALTNVHKHARGAATTVTVSGRAGTELRVEVLNVAPVGTGGRLFAARPAARGGRGGEAAGGAAVAAPLPGAGMGLVGLRERVSLAGGDLAVGRSAAGGWAVRASFPWLAGGRVADLDEPAGATQADQRARETR